MKPYYDLDDETKKIVLELISTCKRVNLGNVSFHYFATTKCLYNVDFFVNEYKEWWELVVKHERKNRIGAYFCYADIYRITGKEEMDITYKYSESDLV